MTDRLTTLIALGWLPGVGPATLRKADGRDDIEAMGVTDLAAIDPRIARALAEAGAWEAAIRAAEDDREQALKAGVQLFTHGGPGYPTLLGDTSDAPFFLYVKGVLAQQNTLAVFGTRDPTQRGSAVANKIAAHFASLGVSIISGLARGIDAAAHIGALDAGGHTVAVLGHGLQMIYPREHVQLAERILDQGGALVSEYPFGTPLVPRRLFERDRIQAGLGQAAVMVQSKPDGGSMHTAKAALRNGRRLYVPAPLAADIGSENPAIEVPRRLTESSAAEICELFRCDAERLEDIQVILSRDDYQKITQYLQDRAVQPRSAPQSPEKFFMRNNQAQAVEPGSHSEAPSDAQQVERQPPELEAKIAQLQEQSDQAQDPEMLAEIQSFRDQISGLETITDQMRRDTKAYTLARKHVYEYYGFDGTTHEQDMLQVILTGMDVSLVYRNAMNAEATDELDFALMAAAAVRDRATLARECPQGGELQPCDEDPAPEYEFQF